MLWHLQTLLHPTVVVGGPNRFAVYVQPQQALVGQGKRTGRAALPVRVGVPPGLALVVVHDQVAVFLHAQPGHVRLFSLWFPLGYTAVDHQVVVFLWWRRQRSSQPVLHTLTVLNISLAHLENQFTVPVFGHQAVSPAELLTFGKDPPAHDSVKQAAESWAEQRRQNSPMHLRAYFRSLHVFQ